MEQFTEYLPFGRPDFSDAEVESVTRVLRSGWVGMGPEVESFERELAEYTGAGHVVAVSSCTSALHLSLVTSGVGAGDEVICPSLTWCSSANAALYLGANVRFCDVDAQTLSVTEASIQAALTDQTKAVVIVHFGGFAVDVESIRKALPDRVTIIEDAAHSLGARYSNGHNVGSSGNPTCFSFYANKNLSTAEGGAIALADADAVEEIQSLRQHGYDVNAWKRFKDPGKFYLTPLEKMGYKANYTDLQAAIGRVQLKRFGELQARRFRIAQIYRDRLSNARPQLRFQDLTGTDSHAHHLFVVLLPIEGNDN